MKPTPQKWTPSSVRLHRNLSSKKLLTGLGTFVLRLSKKALAAAQSFSSALSSAEATSFGFISLIFVFPQTHTHCEQGETTSDGNFAEM